MTHSDPVLLVLPRSSWDALVRTTDPAVRRAVRGLLQVDTRLTVGVKVVDGTVDDVVAAVHLDAIESVADRWAADDDARVAVRTVPVGLERPRVVP